MDKFLQKVEKSRKMTFFWVIENRVISKKVKKVPPSQPQAKKVPVLLLRNREKHPFWAKNNSLISFNLKIAESEIASFYVDSDRNFEKKRVFGGFSGKPPKMAFFDPPPGGGQKTSFFDKNHFLRISFIL